MIANAIFKQILISFSSFYSSFDLILNFTKMSESKNGSKSNLNESNMPLLSEEATEKGGDTPEKEVIEMTETERVMLSLFLWCKDLF